MARDISEIRGEIDLTDDEILRLLNQRARLVAEVATVKQELQVPFYVPSRERRERGRGLRLEEAEALG
ncbi:MAG TPA: chorismate mutase, partial [Polyangia bacterium]|nr:chorismate mutase [Polyangia bacterium]